MAENPLTKLPLAGQAGVAVVVFLVLLGGFWFFWYDDKSTEYAQLEANLETLSAEVTALQATAARLPEFQKKVAALEETLKGLKTILPPAKETPDLMRRVQYLASQSNLDIGGFKPGNTVTKDFYQEWPITLDVTGTYHNLAIFFDRVARLRRLVNIGNVRIRSQGNQTVNNTIAVTCQAKTFVYVEPPPDTGAAAKKKGRR